LPSTRQPAAEPPTDAISSFATSEMSIRRLALTWSAISPPPHCWNRFGGSMLPLCHQVRVTGLLELALLVLLEPPLLHAASSIAIPTPSAMAGPARNFLVTGDPLRRR
jgi:hypothetical protein